MKNCDNLEGKIDCFIDVGILYQKATSKNFKYKDFLKQTYLHLEKEGIYVDENTKKDLKKLIQNKITERFFNHKKIFLPKPSSGLASSENPNGHYSNDFREGIVEVSIGLVSVAYGPPSVKAVGLGVSVDGAIKIIRATANYIWPEPGERDRDRYQERERPSRDSFEHEMDRDRDRYRDRGRNN